ncbi:hypothetical protein ABZY36_28440 [Streptomyces sp. NPDC006627]|uniref:hypothetical protein n=1 Tax=Streptomyces sp. NPDC006627 TaxID=3154679 RepID=UPI0033BF72F1
MSVFRRRLSVLSALSALALASGAIGSASSASAAVEPPVVVNAGYPSQPGQVSQATCPEGTQLVGGGYRVFPVRNGLGEVVDFTAANAPSTTVPNAWEVRGLFGRAGAFAMCSTSSTEAPTVVASSWTGKDATAKATCPEGTRLTGGGYDSRPAVNGMNDNMDEIVINAPAGQTPNTWMARMDKGEARAIAMCAK